MSVSTQINQETNRMNNGCSSPTSEIEDMSNSTYNIQSKSNILHDSSAKDTSFNISMNNSSGMSTAIA
jgi:hypothetical protein